MAAFQFPDPAVTQTVKNPITGSTYQWKEPPGKWVVTVSIRDVGDIIWEGDNPPDPIGDYKLWYSTDTLELYFYYCDTNGVCAWIPTSKPITLLDDLDTAVAEIKADVVAANVAINENTNAIASVVYFSETAPIIFADEFGEQSPLNYKFWLNTTNNQLSILRVDEDASNGYSYAEVSSNPDLEEVLNNGNIADKDIVLTDGVDDLIDISPTEGRIIIASDADLKTPKLTLAHFGDHDEGNRKAEIELDENGTRLDFEMSSEVKDVHFRFGDDEKLIINHEGDAEFTGKVKVEPGTEGNEAVTYSQLSTKLSTPTFDDVLQEGNVADTEATFKKPVTIDMPHSVLEPLVIKGTSDSGTVNSKVLFVQNTSTPTNRTSVRYRGIVDDSYDITNKKYVDSQRTPTPFTWTLEEKISGVGLSSGCMRWDSGKFIYLSPHTYEGIQLLNPTDLATGANNFSSYLPSVGSGVSLARTMKIWKQSSSGAWQLKAWMIPYRYRFWYVGWVQIEYKGVEGDMTPSYGSRYGLSLPDLF